MKRQPVVTLILALVVCGAVAEPEVTDPEKWYSESYAPLWAEDTGTMAQAVAEHYDEIIYNHEAGGKITKTNSREWLAAAIEGWVADAWVGSDLVGLKTDQLNESTAVFKSRWRDRYSDRGDEYSCGWYMADFRAGRWKFTNYASIDCSAHRF